MSVSRELLRQAYPNLLVMRGVATIGGWSVRAVVPPTEITVGITVWDLPTVTTDGQTAYSCEPALIPYVSEMGSWFDCNSDSATEKKWWAALEAGDLLPTIDPREVATWACALADLAAAAGIPERGDEPTINRRWYKVEDEDRLSGEPPCWVLIAETVGGWTDRRFHDIDTHDPIEALCLARASLRKEVKS